MIWRRFVILFFFWGGVKPARQVNRKQHWGYNTNVCKTSVICPSVVSLHPDPRFTPSEYHFTPELTCFFFFLFLVWSRLCVRVLGVFWFFAFVCLRARQTEMRRGWWSRSAYWLICRGLCWYGNGDITHVWHTPTHTHTHMWADSLFPSVFCCACQWWWSHRIAATKASIVSQSVSLAGRQAASQYARQSSGQPVTRRPANY